MWPLNDENVAHISYNTVFNDLNKSKYDELITEYSNTSSKMACKRDFVYHIYFVVFKCVSALISLFLHFKEDHGEVKIFTWKEKCNQ